MPVLAELQALEATMVQTREAIGMPLAGDLVAPNAVPRSALALRPGFAIASLDVAGASMHAPALLTIAPKQVAAGEPLPAGCDAVIDLDAVSRDGATWAVVDSAEPGLHARLTGHDLAGGAIIARAGWRVTPEIALAAELAGVDRLAVRRASIRLEGFAEPETAWLMARFDALGIGSAGRATPHLILRAVRKTGPRLALRPGDAAWIAQAGESIVVDVPARFDGVIGAWCALVLPVLAKLLHQPLNRLPVELTRKVTSAIGFTEVALFRLAAGHALPLAVGDLPLSAIAAAEAYAIVSSNLEGYPRGAQLDLISLDQPFTAKQRS
ncbi:hypothetical protein [Bosea sp. (in: a-proteobacteria)]|uniref:hypothetical protein n=1 Tax=Bosea sp. (in: a-proteobacteria) TaxID=1871050 RepID=UPI0025B8FD2B|nr:hypothetical protein [Bosea sp. (in: a-proteobacteria)]